MTYRVSLADTDPQKQRALMQALLDAAGAVVTPKTQQVLDASSSDGPYEGPVLPFGTYMSEYDSSEFCPKCGTHAPRSELHIVAYNPDHKVLHKHCGRCGFGWNELPQDAPPHAAP